MNDKTTLRHFGRQARCTVTNPAVASEEIIRQALDFLQNAQRTGELTLFSYLSTPGEVATTLFLPEFHRIFKAVCVPVARGSELLAVRIEPEEPLDRAGNFPVPERALKDKDLEVVAPSEIAVAFIPGSAFDTNGHRVGSGKGFYDRYLGNPAAKHIMRIGLAFDCQIVSSIPAETHDQSMDLIVTEKRIVRCVRGS